MSTRASHKHHGCFASSFYFCLINGNFYLFHFFSNDYFNAINQFFVAKILSHFAQCFGSSLSTNKVGLCPRYTKRGFEHFGHIVDRTVTHYQTKIGCMCCFELLQGRVTRHSCNNIHSNTFK